MNARLPSALRIWSSMPDKEVAEACRRSWPLRLSQPIMEREELSSGRKRFTGWLKPTRLLRISDSKTGNYLTINFVAYRKSRWTRDEQGIRIYEEYRNYGTHRCR